MKRLTVRLLSFILSFVVSLSALSCSYINAACYDEADIVSNSIVETNPINVTGLCTHTGDAYLDNVRFVDNAVNFDILVYHHKYGLNNCNHVMYWTIEFVCFNPDLGPQIIKPHTRKGQMYPNVLPNKESFNCLLDEQFSFRLITTVDGSTSTSEWVKIDFHDFL